MRVITSLLLSAFCIFTGFSQSKSSSEDNEQTVYYFIRHAEKSTASKNNKDPELSAIGTQRANSLISIFEEVNFDAIYSTDYIRTKTTGKPLAQHLSLPLTIYHPIDINVEDFVHKTKGKTVLIIGHSNTIPNLVNKIIMEDVYPDMTESEYNNLYKVTRIGSYTNHVLMQLN